MATGQRFMKLQPLAGADLAATASASPAQLRSVLTRGIDEINSRV
jgi:hypothetical protein